MPLDPAADLALKKKLEGPLVSRLRGWVAQLALDLRTQLSGGPSPNLVGMGEPILRSILRDHYATVGGEFDHDLTDAMPVDVPVTATEREAIALDLARVFDEAADEQSALIMATAQGRAEQAVLKAEALIVDSETLTLRDRPMLAANIFKTRQLGGVTSIACTETEWAAERSKGGEAFIVAGGLRDEPKFRGKKIKVWRNQGDSKVRGVDPGDFFNHFDADGQEAEGDGFFIVSGQRLRWPGDMTLGASVGNVANCRCSAIYDVEIVAELRRLFVVDIILDRNPIIPIEPTGDAVLFPLIGDPL